MAAKTFAKQKEDEAGIALSAIRQKIQHQTQQMERLLQYQEEYWQLQRELSTQILGPFRLSNIARFTAHLDTAIEKQKVVLQQLEWDYSRCKDHWQKQHARTKAIHHLEERLNKAIQKQEEKKDMAVQELFLANRFGQDHKP